MTQGNTNMGAQQQPLPQPIGPASRPSYVPVAPPPDNTGRGHLPLWVWLIIGLLIAALVIALCLPFLNSISNNNSGATNNGGKTSAAAGVGAGGSTESPDPNTAGAGDLASPDPNAAEDPAFVDSFTTGTMPNWSDPVNLSHGDWTIMANPNIDKDPIVEAWLKVLKDPAPAKWKTFPNVPNPDVDGFRVVNGKQVPDGVEYGMAESPFCENNPCDFVVPALEYRLITADYAFQGMTCSGGPGCLLLLINVGNQSYTWRNQVADNGFTVHGRYWNGDALQWGVWGLVSHASANMLNMPTKGLGDEVLNAGGAGNAGANCGNPQGCNSVNATVVVQAGNRILAVAKATVTK